MGLFRTTLNCMADGLLAFKNYICTGRVLLATVFALWICINLSSSCVHFAHLWFYESLTARAVHSCLVRELFLTVTDATGMNF